MQIIKSENDEYTPHKHESPRFFKEDLLVVLRERNEIKEELGGVREELNVARRYTRIIIHFLS